MGDFIAVGLNPRHRFVHLRSVRVWRRDPASGEVTDTPDARRRTVATSCRGPARGKGPVPHKIGLLAPSGLDTVEADDDGMPRSACRRGRRPRRGRRRRAAVRVSGGTPAASVATGTLDPETFGRHEEIDPIRHRYGHRKQTRLESDGVPSIEARTDLEEDRAAARNRCGDVQIRTGCVASVERSDADEGLHRGRSRSPEARRAPVVWWAASRPLTQGPDNGSRIFAGAAQDEALRHWHAISPPRALASLCRPAAGIHEWRVAVSGPGRYLDPAGSGP